MFHRQTRIAWQPPKANLNASYFTLKYSSSELVVQAPLVPSPHKNKPLFNLSHVPQSDKSHMAATIGTFVCLLFGHFELKGWFKVIWFPLPSKIYLYSSGTVFHGQTRVIRNMPVEPSYASNSAALNYILGNSSIQLQERMISYTPNYCTVGSIHSIIMVTWCVPLNL